MDALTYESGVYAGDPLFEDEEFAPDQQWLQLFKGMHRYDWNDPAFKRQNKGPHGFFPVPLTQGFFAIAPNWARKLVATYPGGGSSAWQAKIDRDRQTGKIIKVYARRNGRIRKGEPRYVYMTRLLLGLLESKRKVDHVNRWTLDNRCKRKTGGINLDVVSSRLNGANGIQKRRIHHELLRGVEKRGHNKDGKPLYGGIFSRRISRKRVITVRSKRCWLSQEIAHRWYCNQMKRRFGREEWAFDKATLNYPVLPPLKPEYRTQGAAPFVQSFSSESFELEATF